MSSPPHFPPPQVGFHVAQDANTQFEEQFNDQATHIRTNATHVTQENENVWNSQEIFEKISEMAMTAYDAICAVRDHHPQYMFQAQEEPVTLDSAMFPIDLPGIQYPIEPPANNLMPHPHPAGPVHVDPFGGQTIVAPTTPATYDDNQIPGEESAYP
ncbi:hypothetical protein Clacol_002204 [Clathrus columnatus]|uniref:Uncharacterized protein n=1 Tax=Clathrus columnatus TaxID=1419009 RepID=A0AAV5A027_9AGAM|nr:hypothetical protein Clacol_002204 [Clathrus columnatus]